MNIEVELGSCLLNMTKLCSDYLLVIMNNLYLLDTMVQIYSNIMNFEQRLEFPEDDDWKLSAEGVGLIKGLITKQRVR